MYGLGTSASCFCVVRVCLLAIWVYVFAVFSFSSFAGARLLACLFSVACLFACLVVCCACACVCYVCLLVDLRVSLGYYLLICLFACFVFLFTLGLR